MSPRRSRSETGLPLVLLEPSERLDLDATRGWFSERVIGQDQAVRDGRRSPGHRQGRIVAARPAYRVAAVYRADRRGQD